MSLRANEAQVAPATVVDRPLRCVWTNHPTHDRSCKSGIPAAVVAAAWRRELEQGAHRGFFHFTWHGGVWLAYGLDDGQIRGIYCPTHRTARNKRSSAPEDAAPPIALSA
jgi:hypothetical protein